MGLEVGGMGLEMLLLVLTGVLLPVTATAVSVSTRPPAVGEKCLSKVKQPANSPSYRSM